MEVALCTRPQGPQASPSLPTVDDGSLCQRGTEETSKHMLSPRVLAYLPLLLLSAPLNTLLRSWKDLQRCLLTPAPSPAPRWPQAGHTSFGGPAWLRLSVQPLFSHHNSHTERGVSVEVVLLIQGGPNMAFPWLGPGSANRTEHRLSPPPAPSPSQ